MAKRITHEMACLYVLYQNYLCSQDEYLSPSAVDIGDLHIPEFDLYVFTTWKTPTRLTDIFQNNPGLLERIQVVSKSGTKYYKYRLSVYFSLALVRENHLRDFLSVITAGRTFKETPRPELKTCPHSVPSGVICPNCV